MQRLSIRKTREGSFRVGHDKRHVVVRAETKAEAHEKGKAEWRRRFGSVEEARS